MDCFERYEHRIKVEKEEYERDLRERADKWRAREGQEEMWGSSKLERKLRELEESGNVCEAIRFAERNGFRQEEVTRLYRKAGAEPMRNERGDEAVKLEEAARNAEARGNINRAIGLCEKAIVAYEKAGLGNYGAQLESHINYVLAPKLK